MVKLIKKKEFKEKSLKENKVFKEDVTEITKKEKKRNKEKL